MHFALDDQIASQPQAIRDLLARIDVPTLNPQRRIIFTGIGTSLHACRVAAHWLLTLSAGHVRPLVYHAHDFVLSAPLEATDQVIVVTHRGTKLLSQQSMQRAHEAGARVIAVTALSAPEQPHADVVLRTCPDETAGAHTVSYTTALTTLAYLVARLLGERADELLAALQQVPAAIETVLATPVPIESAAKLLGREPLLLTGVGSDAITAAEAALKLKEGTYQWAEAMETENALHGPPAALHAGMGAIAITPGYDDGGRHEVLLRVYRDIGVTYCTCGTREVDDLRFPTVPTLVRPLVAIVPLQRLTAEIARLKTSDPDNIHRDVEPWKSAMEHYHL